MFKARCACGKVVIEATGPSMGRVVCFCPSCQAAADAVDAMPDGHAARSPEGGVRSALFPADGVRVVQGAELIAPHKLRPGSPTTRGVSRCCNSAMCSTFEHWWPQVALRDHAPDADLSPPDAFIFTRFAPAGTTLPPGVPSYRAIPPSMPLGMIRHFLRMKLSGAGKVTLTV